MGGYFHTRKTEGPSGAGLTATQVILLRHAVAGPIRMMRGDRLGTRCVGYEDDTGMAQMVAYSHPEFWLLRRGLIRQRNERHTFDITDAGQAALARFDARRSA